MDNKDRITITIILSLFELIAFLYLFDNFAPFMQNQTITNFLNLLFPSGILYFVNYYIFAPHILKLYYWILDHFDSKRIAKRFDLITEKCVKWLTSLIVKWAPLSIATNFDNDYRVANMFEIVLALFSSGYHTKKPQLFNEKRAFLLSASSKYGWFSRSLGVTPGEETVICTALGLYTFAIVDKTHPIIHNDDRMKNIAEHLWSQRTDSGWGVYVKRHSPDECRLSTTFWALRALNQHSNISDKNDFCNYCISIYEKANNSIFGFHDNDCNSLTVTAMYLLLYFELPLKIRSKLTLVYNPKKACDFVFENFCLKNMQIEIEEFPGISKVDKVPWQHITVSYAVQSLCKSYKIGIISRIQLVALTHHILKIIKRNVVSVDSITSYYHPLNMRNPISGFYTYPTAYLIHALVELQNTL